MVNRIMQQLLQSELSLPFLNAISANTLNNKLRISFYLTLCCCLRCPLAAQTQTAWFTLRQDYEQLPDASFS